jgi:hypothetical protein
MIDLLLLPDTDFISENPVRLALAGLLTSQAWHWLVF